MVVSSFDVSGLLFNGTVHMMRVWSREREGGRGPERGEAGAEESLTEVAEEGIDQRVRERERRGEREID